MLTVAWFLLRRLVAGILVVAGVSILIFLLVRILPGDPARLALGPSATQEQVVELQRQMGFDRPWLTQYAVFVSHATHLDFGISLYTDGPVSTDLAEAFPATLELALAAGLVMAVFGTVLGIASAYDKDGAVDSGSRLLAVVCVAMPNFVWAILLVLVLSYWLDWLPIGGQLSDGMTPVPVVSGLLVLDAVIAGRADAVVDGLRHLLLPAISLALPGLAQQARLTRSTMIDSYAQPYVEFARAYGISEMRIATKYALRPASIPILTVFGMQIVALLGNAFLIEAVFSWPGMARYGVQCESAPKWDPL